MDAATMMEFVLMGMLTAVAWAHARLTVVGAIHVTETPSHMLRRMIQDTWWMVIAVCICYYTLGELGKWILLYALARSMFLLLTNWEAVCANYDEIKRLLVGN
jgi:hypothetical protein